jgi:hypothetical protein
MKRLLALTASRRSRCFLTQGSSPGLLSATPLGLNLGMLH